MRGALVDTSPADLFVRLAEQSATGTLTFTGHDGKATVTFVHGALAAAQVPVQGARRGLRLGERLIHAGRLEADDLDRVLADQATATVPVPLGHMLVERGLVAPDVVRLLLQEQAFDALATILEWQTGQYEFEVDPAPTTRVRVALPVDRALTEIRRRSREAERVRDLVPGPTAVPRATDHPRGDVRMSPDTVSVLTAVDGRVSVGAIASTLGYAYDEASRILYRLALQGLVQFADDDAHASRPQPRAPAPARTAPPGDPERPAAPMSDISPGSSLPDHDEPEPWVGWAHGGPDEPAEPPAPAAPAATPSPAVRTAPAADDQSTPAPDPPPAAPSPSAVDDDTRRALFSELHAVSRAEPAGSGPAAPTPTTEEDGGPDDGAPGEGEEAPDVDTEADTQLPAERSLPDLSRDEMSSLLRELHDLNRDEE